MSGDPSPYVAPQIPFAPPQPPLSGPPSRIKVFGILHIVLGAGSLVILPVSLLLKSVTERSLAIAEAKGGPEAVQLAMSRLMTEATRHVTWFTHAMTVILSILLVIAGIGLVKWKRSGLRFSNLYAWISITGKFVILAWFLSLLPRINHAMEGLVDPGTTQNELAFMKVFALVGVIGGPVISMLYPALALILLNRAPVRAALS